MAPTRPAKITPIDRTLCTTTSLAMVAATLSPNTRKAAKLKNAAQTTAVRGASTRGGHHRGDRVGRVVEAVDVVEAERDGDDEDEEERFHGGEWSGDA